MTSATRRALVITQLQCRSPQDGAVYFRIYSSWEPRTRAIAFGQGN